MNTDRTRTLKAVKPLDGGRLQLHWSDGTTADIALGKDVAAIADFDKVSLGDWGHSVEWPGGHEIGADRLWLETLSATGRQDARAFLEWRLNNGLSLSKAAEALGLARRTIAYYSNGERPIPKAILLACKGWEAIHLRMAA
jgi:hypothetical protein